MRPILGCGPPIHLRRLIRSSRRTRRTNDIGHARPLLPGCRIRQTAFSPSKPLPIPNPAWRVGSTPARRPPSSPSTAMSIDDLGTDWLRPDFKRMIQAFNEYGLVVVVGVVVHGPQDESIWAYLSQLEALGNEVASHSVDHLNLPLLDAEGLAGQVDGSYDTICLNLGKCPVTLILPFGNIDPEGRILAAANAYSFVVGIPGGPSFAGMPPYYLGRIPPVNESQDQTLASLEASFRHEAGELLPDVT